MKLLTAMSAMILSGSLFLSAGAQAGHKQFGHFLLSDRAAAKLDLSEEQRTQISDIVSAQKELFSGFMPEGEKRDEFKALIQEEQFDEAQAKLLIEQMQDKKAEMMLAKLKVRHQIWQVLNAEQREKLVALKGKMKRKMRHH